MSKERPRYLAYLLRLWAESREEDEGCRVSLERIPGGERKGLASLDELVAFLRQQMGLLSQPREDDRLPSTWQATGGPPEDGA